ncbi:MAG TPA: heparin lyase I family protein [Rhodoglobus sp.]|nr:heparin lyase I family protein [Rhodoglobus sp.]
MTEYIIQPRLNTAAGAATNNRVLAMGERGYETDTERWKTGDGATNYNDLPYDDDPAKIAGSTVTGRAVLTGDAAAGRTALGAVSAGEAESTSRAATLRLEELKRNASVWSDLVNDSHIHAGGVVTAVERPVSVSAPSVVTPAATNLLASILPFAGSTLGTLGSGGVLPTGLVRSNNSAVKVLHAIDGDSFDMSYTTQAGSQSCGGFYIDVAPPAAGDYLLSFVADCPSSNTETMQILVRSYHPVNGFGTYNTMVYISEEHAARRVVCRVKLASTDERIIVQVYGLVAGDVGKTARFVMSDFMWVAETDTLPPCGGLLAMPPYSRSTVAASDITINIPTKYAGEHMVVVKTVERGWIAARATLAAGDNDVSDLFPGATITVEEVVAIRADLWKQGDIDVIIPPVYSSVGHHWIDASNKYRRCLSDVSTMLNQPISPRIGTAGTELPYANQMGIERASLHRFEVHENDRNQGGTGPGPNDRAEIVHGTSLIPNTDNWISFWTRLSDLTDPAKFANIMQIRYAETSGTDLSPELSFGPQYGGGIRATCRSDGGTPAASMAGVTSTNTPFAAYEVGKWHRCVLRVNLSTSGGGSLGFWWDGVQIFNGSIPFGYNRYTNEPPEIHHGIYRENSEIPLTLDFQHYEVSTTSLAGRVTAPLPI